MGEGPRNPSTRDGRRLEKVKALRLSPDTGRLMPNKYILYVSHIPDYFLGINVLQELWLQTTVTELQTFWGLLRVGRAAIL